MKSLLTSTALVGALVLVGGCAQQHDWAYAGGGLLLPDGHTQAALISGQVCADPQCWHQDTVTANVMTGYDSHGRLYSEVRDVRPVVTSAAGLAAAEMVVPPLIEGGATVGAGVLVNSGLQHAAAIEAYGNYAAAGETAKGLAAQKPAQIGISNVNGNYNVNGAYATGGAASADANAAANATGGTGIGTVMTPSVITVR